MRIACLIISGALAMGLAAPAGAWTPLGSAFTYQGVLNHSGTPMNGNADLKFRLYGVAAGGSPIGLELLNPNYAVIDGLLEINLDFGAGAFDGQQRWLEIDVRTAGVGSYETLVPRTPLLAAPYAAYSISTGVVPNAALTGTYSNALSFSNAANVLAGNGAALSSLSPSRSPAARSAPGCSAARTPTR